MVMYLGAVICNTVLDLINIYSYLVFIFFTGCKHEMNWEYCLLLWDSNRVTVFLFLGIISFV